MYSNIYSYLFIHSIGGRDTELLIGSCTGHCIQAVREFVGSQNKRHQQKCCTQQIHRDNDDRELLIPPAGPCKEVFIKEHSDRGGQNK